MAIKNWSTTAADNSQAGNDAMIEGMDRDAVNDQSRAQQAALASFVHDGEWLSHLDEYNNTFTVGRAGVLQFNVIDGTGSDAETQAKFTVGDWVKVTGTDSGSDTVVIAEVSALGTYSSPNWPVTVKNSFNYTTFASTTDIPNLTVTSVEHYWSRTAKEGAFHPVGVTVGEDPQQLLTVDNISDPATIAELNNASGLDADTLDGLDSADFALVGALSRNAVLNGSFHVWQRGTTFTAPIDLDYTADCWMMLSDGDLWDVDRESTITPPQHRYSAKLHANGTTNTKGGLFHVMSVQDSAVIVANGKLSLSYDVYLPSTGSIESVRMGICEHDGTPDGADKDPINVWGAEGTDPTLVANWGTAFVNTPVDDEHTSKDDTWTTVTVEDVTIQSTTVQIGIFIWVEDLTYIDGDSVYLGGVQANAGANVSAFDHIPWQQELLACQGRYQQTMSYGVNPKLSGSYPRHQGVLRDPAAEWHVMGTSDAIVVWRFTTTMINTPTIICYAPLSGNSGHCSGGSDGDRNASDQWPGLNCTELVATEASTTTQYLKFHATAEANPHL